ncbi:MAG: TonB-dependent receptor plug domain-containing protein, partial [Bacteroidota bacterium]
MNNQKSIIYILVLFSVYAGLAQNTDSTLNTYQLRDVTITAPRLPNTTEQVPFSITNLDSIINQDRQNLSIKEHLRTVPGVYIQNAYNFTQDARISIRGFGATAAFGIRGIKLIVDGIPETTPDGTGQLDNLNLDLIDDIQVIRGAASSLYGNASGGAIVLRSKFDFDKSFLQSQSMIGSYGFYSEAVSGGLKLDQSVFTGHIRLFGSDGFRDHNKFQQLNSRLAVKHQFNDRLLANFLLEYVDSPKAQDAGGLTLEETEIDFSMARDRNVTFDAGEAITQWKVGTSFEWLWTANKTLNSYAFFNRRAFDGRLPFEDSGTIALKRNYFGVGNSLDFQFEQHTIKIGYDFLSQTDDRQRFDNLE